MIPRIVEISESGRFLAKRHGVMTVSDRGKDYGEVPIDDIGVLMVSAFGATFSKDILVSLAEKGAITILCGGNGHPAAFVTPVAGNYETAQRIKYQINASLPLKKRLWQSIVKTKLSHQAEVLRWKGEISVADKIVSYKNRVQSGDTDNREAIAARIYWTALMGKGFRRNPDGDWPNALFNYGYAVLRASAARAICAAGLLPSLGIKHKNGTNTFPLADDLMEPYRPLVDYYVLNTIDQGYAEVSPASKQELTKFLWADLLMRGQMTPFFTAMERMAVSIVKSFKEKKPLIEIAEITRMTIMT